MVCSVWNIQATYLRFCFLCPICNDSRLASLAEIAEIPFVVLSLSSVLAWLCPCCLAQWFPKTRGEGGCVIWNSQTQLLCRLAIEGFGISLFRSQTVKLL